MQLAQEPVGRPPNRLTSFENDPFLDFLKSLTGKRVHYFPNPGNAGDGFIAHATFELFKRNGISVTAHKQHDSVNGATVLVGGGGNLIEGRYSDVANIIRRHAASNEVVLLPHTIVGFADILVETQRNLTVFCREPVSHRLALLNGAKATRTHLSHDVVFFLEDDYFQEFFTPGVGTLQVLRQDPETADSVSIPPGNLDISQSWIGDLWSSPEFAAYVTRSMAAFVAPHATVQTDRLHVSILSAFLKKRVYMLPNAYFKNRAVFEHSLQPRFPNVEFINTSPRLDALVGELSDESRLLEVVKREVSLREAAERELEHESELRRASETELRALKQSTSWRITGPMRAIAPSAPMALRSAIRRLSGSCP
jgi:exopolysaccharide biosynthesis predicted pyruvyltransferase EpsI